MYFLINSFALTGYRQVFDPQPGGGGETYRLELEGTTDDFLLESGDYLLLETAP